MKSSTLLAVVGVSLALAACNQADPNRTTSVPPGASNPTAVTAPIVTPSAPPAPAERGPIPPNANADAPGTNASLAFDSAGRNLPSGTGAAPQSPAVHVKAQEAAAEAPDTAAADAAKNAALK